MKSRTIYMSCMVMLLWFLSVMDIFSISLEDLIGPEQAAALTSGEMPVLVQFDNPQPQLTPRNDFLKGLIETMSLDINPSVMLEILYLYHKPAEAERNGWSIEEETKLFNGVLSLSTLAGIQYFYTRRGTMRTFLETSQVIDGPSTKKPLPDPVYLYPPAELTVYARQKDTTFGDNIYQYNYYNTPEAILFMQQNLTSLTVGFIPAVRKNNLRSAIGVMDTGDYLLVYAVSIVKPTILPGGLKEMAGDAFSKRAEAILQWFSIQVDKAFKKTGS